MDPAKQREYQRIWRRAAYGSRADLRAYTKAAEREKRKSIRRFLAAVKVTAGCIDCGYREHPDALEFDHREQIGAGAMRVSQVTSWRSAIRELERVDVRCCNCHAIRSQAQRRARATL